ncbi:hypothetical protein SAMN04515656_10930 [Eubacterium aggregans]|uniref:Uncharacterized protein n=1 Tax=Eubacterium aggregans TaxID=81409 RepID=A0A1H4AT33_9FIRM|nr:hypothetical protein [Eubacterium aggregans]MDD4509218.1 hypothetical protein [Eubacteriaceae bacterium]SEA39083.1 hypothetical protein SAMN04515656_10930 [Eubacterium aggregans]
MKTNQPPFRSSNKMLSQVASISENLGRISAYKDLESKPQLRKNNRIRSIHSSLKIEANSLSLSEVQSVIDGQLVLGPGREIQEVKNAYRTYEKLDVLDPFAIADLKRAYGILTEGLEEESGEFRRGWGGGWCI